MSDDPQLTLEAQKAIRAYLIKLFAIPTVLLTLISFVFGFLINRGAEQEAKLAATQKLIDEVNEFLKQIMDKRVDAQSTLTQISTLVQRAAELQIRVDTLSAMKDAATIVDSLANTLKNDSTFKKDILSSVNTGALADVVAARLRSDAGFKSSLAASMTNTYSQTGSPMESLGDCPDANAPKKYEACIWIEGGLDKTYYEAENLCASKGGRLCTAEEVKAAQVKGAEWCNWGWCADVDPNNANRALIAYPMQSAKQGCGKAGFNSSFAVKDIHGYGANCCK